MLQSQSPFNEIPLILTEVRIISKPNTHIFKIPLNVIQYANEILSTFYPHEQSWECSQILYNYPITISRAMEKLLNETKITYEVMINEAYHVPFPLDYKSLQQKINYPSRIRWTI
jgi:hypothetical protein